MDVTTWIIIIVFVVSAGVIATNKSEKIQDEVSTIIIELETKRFKFSELDNTSVVKILEDFRRKSASPKLKSPVHITRKIAMDELVESKSAVIRIYNKMKEKYKF